MKRTLIAATIAALTIPVGFAGPAHASTSASVHVRVDPRDWTWSGTITLSACGKPINSQSFTVNPNSGLHDILEFEVGLTKDCDFSVETEMNTLVDGNATYPGAHLEREVGCGDVWSCPDIGGAYYSDKTGVDIMSNWGELDDWWELKLFPSVFASDMRSNNVVRSGNFITAVTRSKITNYVTLKPNRVTAMAKRFVDAPNSIINIHGYGPDRDVALARAEHVRDHLLAEITRLGGDTSEHPTIVVYAGDPDHKKGVHVTIHQHAASSITVPEGGALTIGGTS